jgi:hypothetical protein
MTGGESCFGGKVDTLTMCKSSTITEGGGSFYETAS